MRKEIIRREALKKLNNGKTYKQVKEFLHTEYEFICSISALRNWKRKLRLEDWDLRDKSKAPIRRNYKFTTYSKRKEIKI